MKKIDEDDGTDPLTIYNIVQGHDMRRQGFNWTDYQKDRKHKKVPEIFNDALEKLDTDSSFEVDNPVVKESVDEMRITTPRVTFAGAVPNLTGDSEANSTDPSVKSTDPKFNACPAFLHQVCRVDGRPCAFSNADYSECGKYYLAASGDPELFEIPFGRESAFEYIYGTGA